MSEKQRLLQSALDALVNQKGIIGAVAVRRDGITMLHRGKAQFSPETFGAMCAVALGATETAFSEIGQATAPTIRAETKTHRLYLCEASQEVLLVSIAERQMDWDALAQAAAQTAAELTKILSS